MRALLFAGLLGLTACGSTALCKSDTLLLGITLNGATANADALELNITVDGGVTKLTRVNHGVGVVTGTVEVQFPGGFPKGKSVSIVVQALVGSTVVGQGVTTVALGDVCVSASLAVQPGGGGVDLGGGGDLVSSPPDLTQCVPVSAENCFNGVDDDCNGMTDCADPACTAGAECVPASAVGFELGTYVAANESCPVGYEAGTTTVNTGLQGATNFCTGCNACTATLACTFNVYEYSTQAVCTADTGLTGGTFVGTVNSSTAPCLANLFNTGSGARSSLASATEGACTPSGTATKTAAGWMTSQKFCRASNVGAGCSFGNVCVAKNANHCALANASGQTCPSGYTKNGTDSWYTGFSDTRTCAACGCGAKVAGDCGRDVNNNPVFIPILFGTSTTCGAGTHASIPIGGKTCSVNADCGSAGWQTTAPNFKKPSCPGISTAGGALTPTGEQTYCCR